MTTWTVDILVSLTLAGLLLLAAGCFNEGGGGDIFERNCIRGQIKDQASIDGINTPDWERRGNPKAKIRDRVLARECSEWLIKPPDSAPRDADGN